MYLQTVAGLGQPSGVQAAEKSRLKQLMQNGLDLSTEVGGRRLRIYWDPGVAAAPYYPRQHPESQAYAALPRDQRASVAATVNQIFRQATGIARKLDPQNAKDKPWVRTWLRLRDVVMRNRGAQASTTAQVWYTQPLPPSEFHRFEQAVNDLEQKVAVTPDVRKRRHLCWLQKLKRPDVDDRVIGWSKICPKTSGAIGAARVVGPCDLTQGMPVDQAALERSIRSVGDVERANDSLHFVTHMRSAIVVAHEMTSLPLENLRRSTDDVGRAIEKLHQWANAPMGGSSAMPPAYRAIKDWIIRRQKDTRSVYSCF
jgi:hypothetical protein